MIACRRPKAASPKKPAWWSEANWNRNLRKWLLRSRRILNEFNIRIRHGSRHPTILFAFRSYSIFTIISNEVRAWTLKKGTPALEAADVIHSDMKKGFIRAELYLSRI